MPLQLSYLFKAEIGRKLLGETSLSNPKLVLQGGGALMHAYASPRFSVDLDWANQLGREELKANIESAYRSFAEKFEAQTGKKVSYSFLFPADPKLVRAKIRVERAGPLGEDYAFYCEFYDVVSRSNSQRKLAEGNKIWVAEPSELMTDKAKACLERLTNKGFIRASDLFDLWYLNSKFGARTDADSVRQKFADYGVDSKPYMASVVNLLQKLESPHVVDDLKTKLVLADEYLKDLPANTYDEIIGTTRGIFEGLRA